MNADNILFLGFADNKRPEFREVKSKHWILFGEDNLFPYHLLYLYDKSSNHGAIVNGKSNYILGQGFPINPEINANYETLNDVFNKAIIDIELFGGCYFQILWAMGGKATLAHIPFEKIRKGKEGGYYYKSNWKDTTKKEEPRHIPEFDPNNKAGVQIYCYREYRPGCDVYALPMYFSALNDIETDVEISKYNLSVIKNGMFSSKMISFFDGTPTDEVKRKLEKDFKNKFAGSENSGRFMLVFNNDPTKVPQVQDLSTTDLDKLFDQLNKTTQSEIFTGHQVTSPMLFGVKTEGQLGGRDEIVEAYEIFKNTYINGKQQKVERIYDFLAPFIGLEPGQKLIPVEPLESAEQPVPQLQPSLPINENMKNLTGRQYQNVERIIRKYKNGKIGRPMAETMLKSGLGLKDEEVTTFLNFSMIELEEEVAEMFAEVGKPKEDYIILKSKQKFNGQSLDEFHAENFKDIKGNDSAIIDLIRKDKRVTPEVIAKTINETTAYVRSRINVLKEDGVLTESTSTVGVDTIIEHAINPEQIDSRTPAETVDVFIRYSYEPKPGLKPIIETTRPFCKRLIELDRLYTRSEIEQISQRVGFSVFDRKGGFWGSKEECRHRWVAHTIIKKR